MRRRRFKPTKPKGVEGLGTKGLGYGQQRGQ